MKLRVKFLASLSELTGVLKTEVPDGATVRKLNRHINGKIWEAERGVVRRKRRLKAYVYNILVNGRAIEWLSGLETLLKDGDEVVFIPPAAGG